MENKIFKKIYFNFKKCYKNSLSCKKIRERKKKCKCKNFKEIFIIIVEKEIKIQSNFLFTYRQLIRYGNSCFSKRMTSKCQ